jgi:iron complex outermembrane recepter protein
MTQVSIRGVSPSVPFGGGAPTVGYYVDAIPFGQVRAAVSPNVNPYDLSRVEVLRGPQGTLYGASALNGVVRVLTNDANTSKFEAKARAGLSLTKGGDASFRTDVAVNIPLIQDKLAIRLIGGVESLGGWIEQPVRNKKNANDSLSRSFRVKVGVTPTDNLRIDLSAWFSHDHYNAAPYADANGTQSTPLKQPGTTKYQAYNAKIAYDLPFMSITSATSYLNFHQKLYTDISYAAPAAPPQLLQLYSDLPGEVTTEELLFNSKGNGPWRWSAGLFYRDAHDDRYQTLAAVLGGKSISWSDRSKSYAAFGQITRTFFDGRFEITGGLRYFHDKIDTVTLTPPDSLLGPGSTTAKVHAITPRVVATWLPSPALTFYASYSQGFRSAINQTPLTLLAAPLPFAKSDKLHNYEIGSKGKLFGGIAAYDVAIYYIKWNDVQQAGSLTYGNPPVYISATLNGTSASGYGADVSLTLQPTKGFQVGGSLSLNDLTEDADVSQNGIVIYSKGERLAFSPKYTASAFASINTPLSNNLDATLHASVNYRSKEIIRALPNGIQTVLCSPTGATVFCTSGEPVFVNSRLDLSDHSGKTLSLFIENLANWKGRPDPAIGPTTEFRPRPRTIGVQFEAKF